jgi:hypothetical protein
LGSSSLFAVCGDMLRARACVCARESCPAGRENRAVRSAAERLGQRMAGRSFRPPIRCHRAGHRTDEVQIVSRGQGLVPIIEIGWDHRAGHRTDEVQIASRGQGLVPIGPSVRSTTRCAMIKESRGSLWASGHVKRRKRGARSDRDWAERQIDHPLHDD